MKVIPDDITGLVGIMPTPASPDAGHWQTVNTLNLPETERMTRLMVESGVDVLLSTGTFGECATITNAERKEFVACVASAVNGRRPFFAGIGSLNTRDTIAQARDVLAAGADGLFVGRPMWLALDDVDIVRYHRDLADALPNIPMLVYDNPLAFKGKIKSDVYAALGEIREVVAAKHIGGPSIIQDAQAVEGKCRVLPLTSDWYKYAKEYPDLILASWTGHIACAPAPLVALADAIKKRDWANAEQISQKCNWAEQAMFSGGDLASFMDYSIQIGHLRFEAAGLINPGPPRPPYLHLPEQYRNGAIECGRRWAMLQEEFLPAAVG